MIDAESAWKSSWADLPLDPTGTVGGLNIANDVDSHVTNKLSLAAPFSPGPSPILFTFQKSILAGILSSLVASPDPVVGRTAIATGWQSAVLASILIVGAGASTTPVPTPPTQFSAPPVVVPTVALVTLAYNALVAELLAAPLAEKAEDSAVPVALRNAFLAIGYDVTGLNSIIPPVGPLPLVALAVGVE